MSFVCNFSRQGYPSNLGLGEDMRQETEEQKFSLSSIYWRIYGISDKMLENRSETRSETPLYDLDNFMKLTHILSRFYLTHILSNEDKLAGKPQPVPDEAPDFVRWVLGPMIAGEGDALPVSSLPIDGTYPSGTACWEKRNIALEIPVWDPDICIQCGKCVMVCPHAVIRMKVYEPNALQDAPESFVATDARFREFPGMKYTLQVSPEDCTGCGLCVEACPVKNKREVGRKAINMAAQPPLREREKANWEYFLTLPEIDATQLNTNAIKESQLLLPLFEFSGACSGCGETPYIKLVSQLFGDHMIVANATGCSSIYGGNLPTTPWTSNAEGRVPAWSNSLFEDNAEFGLGMRVTLDKQQEYASELLVQCTDIVGEELVRAILHTDQSTQAGIQAQREPVALLKQRLQRAETKDGALASSI